jgi:uncharacterized protein YcbX
LRVVSLHFYPIKGVRAVDVARTHLTPQGLDHDRRWLVVDPNGMFLTQRVNSLLATIIAIPTGNGLKLSAPGAGEIAIDAPAGDERLDIVVWDAKVNAALADARAHAWLSKVLGEEVLLVHMDARAVRLKRSIWTSEALPVTFADAYPVLIATTGSLAAVNADIAKHGGDAVPMARFRPNIVIDCKDAWVEDHWKALRIGALELDLVKPCDRCVVTTKDQMTGESMGNEPIASLTRLRMSADPRVKGVLFGWNSVPRAAGTIEIGDRVDVIDVRAEGFPIKRA